MSTTKGVYLVANLKSQVLCENLVYSIRQSGCSLPIKLIHFGGDKVDSAYILSQVEFIEVSSFPSEAVKFIDNLQTVLTDCPRGYLHRFLAWFGEWDEFIYSDNDIVALTNWEELFSYLPGYDLVHADEEFLTKGRFNHENPESLKKIFGENALESAFTAGHFLSVRNDRLVNDINKAISWFKKHPGIAYKHDQALLHIACLIGGWKMLNLCKSPTNWLTTWAGDYKNSLDVIQAIQIGNSQKKISHLHYSGRNPNGTAPIEELIFSSQEKNDRLKKLMINSFQELAGIELIKYYKKRVLSSIYRYTDFYSLLMKRRL